MANTIQLKRRVSGVAGAPAALKSGELAHNEVDNTVYAGKGDDGAGNATSIVPIAGTGGFLALTGTQTIGGAKTFSLVPKSSQDASGGTDLVRKSQLDSLLAAKAPLASPALTGSPTAPTAVAGTNSTQIATTAFVNEAIAGFGAGDMAKSIYDTDNDGKVDAAEVADAAPWSGITGKPTSFTPSSHGHSIAQVTGLQTALDAKAPLVSPALTGSPTAPTATTGTNTTQIATTAFVAAAFGALIDAAPGAMDTLNELAAALGDDPNFATTVTNALAGKLSAASNLSDVANKATARSNLGLAPWPRKTQMPSPSRVAQSTASPWMAGHFDHGQYASSETHDSRGPGADSGATCSRGTGGQCARWQALPEACLRHGNCCRAWTDRTSGCNWGHRCYWSARSSRPNRGHGSNAGASMVWH